jgi:hypothetical protein
MSDKTAEVQGARMITLLEEIVRGITASGDKNGDHLKGIADELKHIQDEIKKRETFNQKLSTIESILAQLSSDVSSIQASVSILAFPDEPLQGPF